MNDISGVPTRKTGASERLESTGHRALPGLELLEKRELLASAVTPAASTGLSTSFVMGLYHDLLSRTPSAAEVSAWTTGSAEKVTPGVAATRFTASSEHLSSVVSATYQRFLGRAATPADRAFWIGELQSGLSADAFTAKVLASNEYYKLSGGTPGSWLNAMFLAEVGRAPDPSAVAAWGKAGSDATARFQIVQAVQGSAEVAQSTVTQLYKQFLMRAPDSAAMTYWSKALEGGLTTTQMTIDLMASSEYRSLQSIVMATAPGGPGGQGSPLAFEKNMGQTNGSVDFLARTSNSTVFVTPTELATTVTGTASSGSTTPQTIGFIANLVGANSNVTATGLDSLSGKSNYFLGNDPSAWLRNIPNYGGVLYKNVYQGVDLHYYGAQGQLEYDFIVNPGADAKQIVLSFTDSTYLSIGTQGQLLISLPGAAAPVSLAVPKIYQTINDQQRVVTGGFVLLGHGQVGFQIGAYDKTAPLIIDPTINYATFLGGSDLERATGVAADANDNAYVTGNTESNNFPVQGGVQGTFNGGTFDMFVTAVDPSGHLIYSTYLGGSGADYGQGVAVDSSGDAFITGTSGSKNFPTSGGAFQTSNAGGNDVTVTKLDPTGSSILYSTYIGGSQDDEPGSPGSASVSTLSQGGSPIAIDSSGDAYVTGHANSTNYPVTSGVVQSSSGGFANSCFVTKLNATGTGLVYSTYICGTINENTASAIAVDASGSAYVTGRTTNFGDFPTTPGAFQTYSTNVSAGTSRNAYVLKLNPTATAYSYATLLSGSGYDEGFGIAVDSSGSAYVAGETDSKDFPTTAGAFQRTFTSSNSLGGISEGFVTKFNPDGSGLDYSTYLGGSGNPGSGDAAYGIVVDSSNNAYVTGKTGSADFPVKNAVQPTFGGSEDAFITVLNNTGTGPLFSTFFGGSDEDLGNAIALDADNNLYVAGETRSKDFPVTPGAIQTKFGGSTNDGFLLRVAAVVNPGGNSNPLKVYAPFRFIYDPVQDIFRGNITLSNTGKAPIKGPITLDFPDLPAGVSIANANSTAPDGTPSIVVSVASLVRGKPIRIPIYLRDPFHNPLSTFFTGFDIIATHK